MTAHSPHYLVLGQLLREFLVTPDQEIRVNQPGGNLLYAAEGLALWIDADEKIGLVARVGEDYPRAWLDNLREKGYLIDGIRVLPEEIDLRYFRAYEDLRTVVEEDPVKVFAKLETSMPRALLGYQPPSHRGGHENLEMISRLALRKSDLPDSLGEVYAAHICPMDYLSQSLMPAALREVGIDLVTMDPGRFMQPNHFDAVRQLVIGLTAFLPSEEELTRLFHGRTTDIWEMVDEIIGWGVEAVVVKRSWKGQLLYDSSTDRRFDIPAYPSSMVDPTGAGDVFAGGFLAGLGKTSDPLEALLYGNVAASFAVEGSGPYYTRESLPGLEAARLASLRETVKVV
jgi:hypothetical protein